MSCVTSNASSRPEIFVNSMMPPGPSSREEHGEAHGQPHMTTCASTTRPPTAIHEPTFRWPDQAATTMTATIDPGPARSGVLAVSSATFTLVAVSEESSRCAEDGGSMATKGRKQHTPPESWASIEIHERRI